MISSPHLVCRYYERVHGRYAKRPAHAIECIPKFGFGTTHEIVADDDEEPTTTTTTNSTGFILMPSTNCTTCENESGSSGCSSLSSTSTRDDAPPPPPLPVVHHQPSQQQQDHKLTKKQFQTLVMEAIDLGVRHFDCAPLYRTQPLMGECLKLATELVPRQDFFITSKLPPNMMRGELITRSITKSIEELRCSYLDLFLIHAPFATKHVGDDDQFYPRDPKSGQVLWDDDSELLELAWRQVVEFKRRGLTRFVGVSNVNKSQIERLQRIHPIDVVQNEYHLYNQDRKLFDFCDELDIHYQSYATFGSPAKCRREGRLCAMDDPLLLRIAREHQLTPAQVVIMWAHPQPMAYVVRSDTSRQLEENFNATRFTSLSINQLIELDAINMNVQVHLFKEHAGIESLHEYPFKEVRERPPECIHPPHREDLRKYYLENYEQVVRHEQEGVLSWAEYAIPKFDPYRHRGLIKRQIPRLASNGAQNPTSSLGPAPSSSTENSTSSASQTASQSCTPTHSPNSSRSPTINVSGGGRPSVIVLSASMPTVRPLVAADSSSNCSSGRH